MAGALSTVTEGLVSRLFVRGVVRDVESITPRMRRIRIHARALAELPYQAGQHVRVKVGNLLGLDLLRNETLRAYTIWAHDRAAATLDLCVLDHPGQGPGARWAMAAQPGDAVTFRPPEGKLVARPRAGLHLFVGDETAAVAFGAIMRALPSAAKVVAIIETESVAERLPLQMTHELRWLVRGARPSGDPALLVGSTRTAAALLRGRTPGAAYLAGEARACKALRRLLIGELGWARGEIALTPFWMPGSKGLE